ncbi:HEAT repeat domain-containing protein [Bremerella cremea]|uniref:HEAT repeat domain-containing protein n=1 Tax=Bremerella cremea TaxID=1031537 RepID=UPI0031E740E4
MIQNYVRANSILASLLALAAAVTLLCGSGCRSVVSDDHALETLASEPSPEQPKSLPGKLTSTPMDEAAKPDVAVTEAEAILAANVIQSKKNDFRPRKISSRGWYHDAGTPLYRAIPTGTHLWRHQSLERLLDQPESPCDTLLAGTRSTDAEVQSTAMIGLARLGESVDPAALGQLVEDETTTSATKAALLEAIVLQPTQIARPVVAGLFDRREALLSSVQIEGEDAVTLLEQQLWVALAAVSQKIEDDPQFIDAFAQQKPEIQETILDLLLVAHCRQVPEPIQQRFGTMSTQAIRRVGLWPAYLRSVAPVDRLLEQTRSADFPTREAATIGLGREGSKEAREALEAITENDSTLVQVAAVIAWAQLDDHLHWTRLAEAPSWRVRLAVAEFIPIEPRHQFAIEKLSEDNSRQVREAIEARAGMLVSRKSDDADDEPKPIERVELSPEEAITILDLIDQSQHAADESQRVKARQTLLLEPAKVLTAVDQAAEQLANYENDYLFQVLLPQCDPLYRRLEEAISDRPQLALGAARQLAQHATQHPLPELVVWRIYRNIDRFTPMTWPVLLEMVHDDQRPPAEAIVRRALGTDLTQVRIAAYEHVSRYPLPDVASQLCDGLEHEMPAVRIAAIEALQQLQRDGDRHRFAEMLLDSDIDVQLAACRALDQFQDPRGSSHLNRMTYSSSKTVRLLAVQSIAARNNDSDIPTLIRALDDETAIRSAALDGLSSLVPKGQHPGQISPADSLDARCAAWKNWFDRQASFQ